MTNRRARKTAFTLTELLVVISILILILAMAIPAFSAMLYSSALATAQNSLAVAIAGARDAAVRSAYGQDSAAVFIYTPNGRLTVIPCVEVGVLKDRDPNDPNNQSAFVDREVFVPATGVEPVQLPGSWAVSGFATIGMIDDNPLNPSLTGWYDSGNYPPVLTDPPHPGNWVFPETGFFGQDPLGKDNDDGKQGQNRQTFMIRFQGGTGAVEVANLDPVLVVLPSKSLTFRSDDPWQANRLDVASDLERAVQRITADPSLSDQDRQELLGDIASDTVLARPVPQVALYNLRKLGAGVRASRLSRTTGSLYYTDANGVPKYDPSIFDPNDTPADIAKRVNEWIQATDENDQPIESDAIIYSFQRYLGTPQELIPPEEAP